MTEIDRLTRIRAALQATVAALTAAHLDGLLAAESALADALHASAPLPSGVDRAAVRREIDAARADLRRCRRLGGALVDLSGGGDYTRTAGSSTSTRMSTVHRQG